jgi:hypothetical protein
MLIQPQSTDATKTWWFGQTLLPMMKYFSQVLPIINGPEGILVGF